MILLTEFSIAFCFFALACNVRPPAAVASERTELSLPKIEFIREITISGYRKLAIAAGGG